MDSEPVRPRKQDKRSRKKEPFAGFTQEDVDKYFCMPNMVIDIIAEIDSLAELKVVLYIMRHTWGFHEYAGEKKFTVDEFMYGRKYKDGSRMDGGTRLSEMSVRNGLELAIEHGYVFSSIDDKDKAKVKKSYGLHIRDGVKIVDPSRKKGAKSLEVGVQKLYPTSTENTKVFRSGSEKDKEETHQEKDTVTSSSIEKLPSLLNLRMKRVYREYHVDAEDYKATVLDLFRRKPDEEAFKVRVESAQHMSATIEQFFDNLSMLLSR